MHVSFLIICEDFNPINICPINDGPQDVIKLTTPMLTNKWTEKIDKDNVVASQFNLEKNHHHSLQLLINFIL